MSLAIKYLLKILKNLGLILLAGIFLVLSANLLTSCQTFEPVQLENTPPECNLAYSAMRLYGNSKDKSGVAPALQRCQKVLQRNRCRKEVFGEKEKVDYSQSRKYRDFNECLKELD